MLVHFHSMPARRDVLEGRLARPRGTRLYGAARQAAYAPLWPLDSPPAQSMEDTAVLLELVSRAPPTQAVPAAWVLPGECGPRYAPGRCLLPAPSGSSSSRTGARSRSGS